MRSLGGELYLLFLRVPENNIFLVAYKINTGKNLLKLLLFKKNRSGFNLAKEGQSEDGSGFM